MCVCMPQRGDADSGWSREGRRTLGVSDKRDILWVAPEDKNGLWVVHREDRQTLGVSAKRDGLWVAPED